MHFVIPFSSQLFCYHTKICYQIKICQKELYRLWLGRKDSISYV